MAPSSPPKTPLRHLQDRLPQLLYACDSAMRTNSLSRSTLQLAASALKPWPSFFPLVSDTLLPLQKLPIISTGHLSRGPRAKELMLVGNRNGVLESFKRNIDDVLLPVQGLLGTNRRLYFADPEVTACGKSETEWKGTTTIPDVAAVFTSSEWVQKALRGEKEPDIVAAVGVVRTPWTTEWLSDDVFGSRDPENAGGEQAVLVHHMGQLAQYMDDARVTYGFYTNYVATVFIRRRTEEEFLVSPPVFWNDSPYGNDRGEEFPSVRMCFLALARWIRDPLNRVFPKQIGPALTQRCFTPPENKIISSVRSDFPASPPSENSHSPPCTSTRSSDTSTTMASTLSIFTAPPPGPDVYYGIELVTLVNTGLKLTFTFGSTSTIFTVATVFSRSNQKLVMTGTLSMWPSDVVVAKFRCPKTTEQRQQAAQDHAQELAVLSRLVGSPLFPSLFGAGFVGSFPVLVMRYIPPPYKMCLDLWCASDDIQDVVKEGIRAAVETMKGLGMRHTDWKAENVLYHPESGYVAVVDLKGVETWEGGSGEEEEEEEEVEVAWKNIMEVG